MAPSRTSTKVRPRQRASKAVRSDLSDRAFGNVDAAADTGAFVSYLDTATEQFRNVKQFSRGLLELKPGAAVLEVGCGTGDDLREIAAVLGPQGLAIGVDSSRAMVAEARRRVGDSDLEIEFIVRDAERLDFGSDCFDACRADRLFQHLEDPMRALKEMVRVALPGGVVQVLDRDWEMVAVDGTDRSVTRTIMNRICDGIRNGWVGRRLPAMLRECGLRDVRTDAIASTTGKFAIANTMLDLEEVARKASVEGLIGAKVSAAWIRDLKERDRRGCFFASWVTFVVTGRKRK
jgi:ubiquinone/menaquinone biosynthesis C-methylase UbiE